MANQLCHSAETNHHIAESITVSHGNTSPQLSVFIKPGQVPLSKDEEEGDNGNAWYAPSLVLLTVKRAGCNLYNNKTVITLCYQARHDLR